jgi:anti-anti-sigma factor
MEIKEEQINGSITKIILSGRLDIQGVGEIETKFSGMTASPRMAIITDMSNVPYISSIGIRLLISSVKAINARKGKFALFGTQPDVNMVIIISGLDKIIPNFDTLEAAIDYVK